MPTVNGIAAAGMVSLPGMMTGQIPAEIPLLEELKYHILIMFLIVDGTGIGLFTAVFRVRNWIVDCHHRLRFDRLD